MLQEDGLRKKRQQFHCLIRRQKRDEYFKIKRAELMQQTIISEQKQFMSILNTVQKKQQWVHSKALLLTGMPCQQWRRHIDDLYKSLLCFKPNFRLFIELGIVRNLSIVFQDDYLEMGLGVEVAKLFGHMIYYQTEQTQSISYVVEEILLNSDVLLNVCARAMDVNLTKEQKYYFLILIANVAASNKSKVYNTGGLKVFLDWSKQLLKQSKINSQCLNLLYQFLNCMVIKSHPNQKISYGILNPIVSTLQEYCQTKQNEQFIRMILVIVTNILRRNSESIYSTVLDHRILLRWIFDQAVHQKETLRSLAWNVLAMLSVSNKQIGDIFQEFNFYEIVNHAYSYEVKDAANFDKITESLLTCIGNIAWQGQPFKENILRYKLIDIAIDSVHPQRSKRLKINGYFCLNSVLLVQNYELYTKIIYDYPIALEKLVTAFQIIDPHTIYETTSTIIHLIKKQNAIFRQEGNIIISILQTNYNFQKILDAAEIKFANHARICENINVIRDLQCVGI